MKHIAWIAILLLAAAAPLDAQWEQLPGPYGCGSVNQDAFFREGDTIFLSLSSSIYKSTDEGHHWTFMPVNLPIDYGFTNLLYLKCIPVGDPACQRKRTRGGRQSDRFEIILYDGRNALERFRDTAAIDLGIDRTGLIQCF